MDEGLTWKQRGVLRYDNKNKLTFIATQTEDTKWPKELLQTISERILSKKSNSLIYQLRFIDNNSSKILSSISMCDLIGGKFKEVWNLITDKQNRLLSVTLSTEHIQLQHTPTFTPIYYQKCNQETISLLEKWKGPLLQNGVRESVKVNVIPGSRVVSEKVSFAGVKSPEQKKKEVEEANEPGFLRKYVS
ncbi:hypothetical protein ABK040_016729 [Willaertia magna]